MDISLLKQRARALRQNQTDAEKKLWYYLRANRFENRKFYRQFIIYPYIVDFINRELKLVIELDGGHHLENTRQDCQRTKYLIEKGYLVVRFWNNQIMQEIDGVLEALSLALSQRGRG